MIYHLISDTHLEFEYPVGKASFDCGEGDVLLLAGDIYCPWTDDEQEIELVQKSIEKWSKGYDKVLMVCGNHEHYGGTYEETFGLIRSQMCHIKNFRLLENEVEENGDELIFGATLWTDFNNDCPMTTNACAVYMSDYTKIRTCENGMDSLRMTTGYVYGRNRDSRDAMLEFAERCTNEKKRPIIMTHHWPVVYVRDRQLTAQDYAYYNTRMEEIQFSLPEDYIWVCGHTHDRIDKPLYNGHLYANCRGYVGYESQANKYTVKEIE